MDPMDPMDPIESPRISGRVRSRVSFETSVPPSRNTKKARSGPSVLEKRRRNQREKEMGEGLVPKPSPSPPPPPAPAPAPKHRKKAKSPSPPPPAAAPSRPRSSSFRTDDDVYSASLLSSITTSSPPAPAPVASEAAQLDRRMHKLLEEAGREVREMVLGGKTAAEAADQLPKLLPFFLFLLCLPCVRGGKPGESRLRLHHSTGREWEYSRHWFRDAKKKESPDAEKKESPEAKEAANPPASDPPPTPDAPPAPDASPTPDAPPSLPTAADVWTSVIKSFAPPPPGEEPVEMIILRPDAPATALTRPDCLLVSSYASAPVSLLHMTKRDAVTNFTHVHRVAATTNFGFLDPTVTLRQSFTAALLRSCTLYRTDGLLLDPAPAVKFRECFGGSFGSFTESGCYLVPGDSRWGVLRACWAADWKYLGPHIVGGGTVPEVPGGAENLAGGL
ncbi:hypothetical protein TeGR_g6442 [Tetraparma gracilis]|uniref:Uncharacterized protein n=1 Tax=Tetraparma gracilis TaxID=2962635 RepID=A0ABQ6N983_9STRA|nr:hypothetical protein TeGR_g6442 [Tetraparma gracilis]